jgi:competence protein ComEA
VASEKSKYSTFIIEYHSKGETMKKILLVSVIAAVSLFAKVDINSANVEELSTIKGIGEKKATAIVEYRKEHCFKNVSELVNVKGIGEKTVEKIKKDITAGKCPVKKK